MIRFLYLLLLLNLLTSVGCSSLFNPDHAITSALQAYLPEESDGSGFDRNAIEELDSAAPEPAKPAPHLSSSIKLKKRNLPERNQSESGSSVENPLNPATLKARSHFNQAGPNRNLINREPAESPEESPEEHLPSWEKIERELKAVSGSGLQKPREPMQQKPGTVLSIPRERKKQSDQSVQENRQPGSLPAIADRIHGRRPFPASTLLIPRLNISKHVLPETPTSSPPSKDIVPETTETASDADITWKDSLAATIEHLREELESQQVPSKDPQLNQCLKILSSVEKDPSFVSLVGKLELLKGSLPRHQYEAIRKIIQATDDKNPNLMVELNRAVREVASSAELEINNPQLCLEVEGFGKFKKTPSPHFSPGDEVLLYCELNNFSEETSEQGHAKSRTCRFDAQVEFLDASGETNVVKSFANIQDHCQSERTDFYLFFRLQIPKLEAGQHKIQLRFTDLVGRKKATLDSPLEITVVP